MGGGVGGTCAGGQAGLVETRTQGAGVWLQIPRGGQVTTGEVRSPVLQPGLLCFAQSSPTSLGWGSGTLALARSWGRATLSPSNGGGQGAVTVLSTAVCPCCAQKASSLVPLAIRV